MNPLEQLQSLWTPTLAYLDPGSGVVLAQMLLAGVAGIGLFLKYQGRRLLALIGLRKPDAVEDHSKES